MHLKNRMEKGMLFYEHGHKDQVDIQQEQELDAERKRCKEVMFDYNNTRPSEDEKRTAILKGILGDCGDHVFIENPVHMSYGTHVHLGEHFYANFNLVIVDDMDVYIGDRVMIGPNVTNCSPQVIRYIRFTGRWWRTIPFLSILGIMCGLGQILWYFPA